MLSVPRLQAVPHRALAISLAALAIPVAVVFWLPDWASNGLGMLIWLTALIPAFLLSYYRGLAGVAMALAGGMAVITATQVSVVAFDIADPDWTLLIGIVGVYLAISIGIAALAEMLRRERRAAEEMALLDRLTGLPNRRHLEIALEGEFAGAERGRGLTIVLCDLDRFKLVNDRHGHAAGDHTLKTFAKILQTNTRKENLSARFGGEEFVTILRDSGADAGVKFAQRVLDQLRDWPLSWGPQTASAGVATYEPGMGSWEFLLGAADRALYQAKEGGRDMVCVAPKAGERPSGAMRRAAVPEGAAEGAAEKAGAGPAVVYVVDDDPAVRSVLKRFLVKEGYVVWDSGDPLEVVRRFAAAPPAERPDVILTDMIMPAMTGVRMIDEIAKVGAELRVIYMSGYMQSRVSWKGTPGAVVAFLEKPITREALLGAVERVLAPEAQRADAAT